MSGTHHLGSQVQPNIIGHGGGFASHIRAHWAWAIPLPEKLNFAEAGPLMCGGITVFAPLAMYAKPTDRVGIIGIGGVGGPARELPAAVGWGGGEFTWGERHVAGAERCGADPTSVRTDAA